MPAGVDAATAIDRRTLSAQIYRILEAKVLSGELAPGSKLSEESLAEAYGVSRSPAREALADLERVGLAVRVGMRDRMITVPTPELIAQKYDLWWIVDGGRTYLASLDATPEEHAELRGYVDEMAQAAKRGDLAAYRRYGELFHSNIRNSCRNTHVNQFGADCDLYIKWFETLYDRDPEISMRVADEHYKILEAFERQDLAGLYEIIRTHLLNQRSRILATFAAMIK